MWKLLKFLMTFCGVVFFGGIVLYIVGAVLAVIAMTASAL